MVLLHPAAGGERAHCAREKLGVVCYGKVYRKDEIDRKHMNIFHQFGGWYLTPADTAPLTIDDLRDALSQIVKGLFGADAKYRFLDDTFPYTDPSLQVEVDVNGQWIEILGGGMTKQSVFKKFGVEGYNAWAFGFGLGAPRHHQHGTAGHPPFVVDGRAREETASYGAQVCGGEQISGDRPRHLVRGDEDFAPNVYFDLVRDVAGDLAEQVALAR